MRRPVSIRATIFTALLLAAALTFPAAASAGKYAALGSYTGASLFAAQPDGKLLLRGSTKDCSELEECVGRPFIARIRRSGELDTGFGAGNGIARIPIHGSRVGITAASLQANGKIVVVGASGRDEHATWFVVRLRPNGNPDRSFGSSGRVRLPSSIGYVSSASLAIDSNRRIIVVGSRYPGLVVAALLPSGRPDESFGDGGVLTGDFDSDAIYEEPEGLAILDDDRILISGTSETGFPGYGYYIGLAQFLANGSPDPSFGGGDGRAIGPGIRGQTGEDPGHDRSGGMPIVSANGITIVGHAGQSGWHQCPSGLITRFDREGNWDPSYGSSGVRLFRCVSGFRGVTAADGSLLVSGSADYYDLTFPRVGRFNPDGSADVAFNRSTGPRGLRPAGLQGYGTGVVEVGGSSFFSASMMLDPCKAYARPKPDCQVATVTKLKKDGSLDRSFGTAGVTSFPPLKLCRRNPLQPC